MSKLDHEGFLREQAGARRLAAGVSYVIDRKSRLISRAMTWVHGDLWFIDHFDPIHPLYRREYQQAIRNPATIWKISGDEVQI